MFLKSLTLKGFKSFADKTTLEFEPGVCVVVGPNGSGKSNVVDSVAWVLGAQGARALRGAKMDDVIFAGTADRPALGRAEVSLTIDNTAHLLPIEFSEVTITRTLFRTGDSEYMLNGAPCRLLDIQELLSDTGIGRQQHVIVGQGQLDSVLNARPEERRAIIEEAAGILKFRKRREKAQRRLEATEGNLLRLTDLLREVRRQLRPLERQADAARRHDGLVSELRAITLHLAGRELDTLRVREERRRGQRAELAEQERELRVELRTLDDGVLEAEHAIAIPGDDDVSDLLTRAEALRERARGLSNLVAERLRGLERELLAVADEGVVETLVAEAASVRHQLTEVDADFATLAPTRAEVEAAEARVAELRSGTDSTTIDAEWHAAQRDLSQAEQRERTLGAELGRVREQSAQVARELYALGPQLAEAESAEENARNVRTELEAHTSVAAEMTEAAQVRVTAEQRLSEAEAQLRGAEATATRWRARADTLAAALEATHAADGGRRLASGVDGVVGPLVDNIVIEPGTEVAVASALGDALRAVVVQRGDALRRAVEHCKRGDDHALLLVLGSTVTKPTPLPAPAGTRPLAGCVRATRPGSAPADLDALLTRLLAPFVLVDRGWAAALDVALDRPDLVAVTPEGDRFGGETPWRAGPPGSTVVTPAALAEAESEAATAEAARGVAEAAHERAQLDLAAARRAELAAAERERTLRHELDQLATPRVVAATCRRGAVGVARRTADGAAHPPRRARGRSRRVARDAAGAPRPRPGDERSVRSRSRSARRARASA